MNPSQVSSSLRRIASQLTDRPDKSAVRREIVRVAAALRAAASQKELEEKFYPEAADMIQKGEWYQGSQAFWGAFQELGIVDWTPATDLKAVEAKLLESFKDDPERAKSAVRDMHKNYQSYKRYEPNYLQYGSTSNWPEYSSS